MEKTEGIVLQCSPCPSPRAIDSRASWLAAVVWHAWGVEEEGSSGEYANRRGVPLREPEEGEVAGACHYTPAGGLRVPRISFTLPPPLFFSLFSVSPPQLPFAKCRYFFLLFWIPQVSHGSRYAFSPLLFFPLLQWLKADSIFPFHRESSLVLLLRHQHLTMWRREWEQLTTHPRR